MTRAEVRPAVAAKLDASAQIAAFGPVSVFSAIADIDTARKAFEARLEQYGVVVEVGAIVTAAKDAQPGRLATLSCRFSVLIFESFTVTHSPSEDALVQVIMDQMRQPIAPGVFAVFIDDETDTEAGASITALNFSVNIDNRGAA
jgi:hypothetical protein